jgi:hypothetical protein
VGRSVDLPVVHPGAGCAPHAKDDATEARDGATRRAWDVSERWERDEEGERSREGTDVRSVQGERAECVVLDINGAAGFGDD